MNDSVTFYFEEIAKNTEPFLIENFRVPQLAFWSFVIAILSLFAGIIAAIYSYKGYVFQRKATEQLESLMPGHISLYGIAVSLIKNILALEAIYFGKKGHQLYPTKMILSMAKLPDDLLQLEKYEKNKICFDDAFNLKVSWQNYNDYIDTLIEYSSKNDEKAKALAQHLLDYSKAQICRIQSFEETMLSQSFLEKKSVTNESISFFIMDYFFERINLYKNVNDLDTSRNNLSKENQKWYIMLMSYLPNTFNINKYLLSNHKNSLENIGGFYASLLDYHPNKLLESIKNGEFDYLGKYLVLPPEGKISNMDITDFKTSYFNYIEPLLIGYTRKTFLDYFEQG